MLIMDAGNVKCSRQSTRFERRSRCVYRKKKEEFSHFTKFTVMSSWASDLLLSYCLSA